MAPQPSRSPLLRWIFIIICIGLLTPRTTCQTTKDITADITTGNPANADTNTTEQTQTNNEEVTETPTKVNPTGSPNGNKTETDAPGTTKSPVNAGTEASPSQDVTESPAGDVTEAAATEAPEETNKAENTTEGEPDDANAGESNNNATAEGTTRSPNDAAVTTVPTERPAKLKVESDEALTTPANKNRADEDANNKGNSTKTDDKPKETQQDVTSPPKSTKAVQKSTLKPQTNPATTKQSSTVNITSSREPMYNVTGHEITHQSVTIYWEQINKEDDNVIRLVGYKLTPFMEVESKFSDLFIDATNQTGRHRFTIEDLAHHTSYMFCVVPYGPQTGNETNDVELEITDGTVDWNTTDCFVFRTPYNPLNPKAVVAFAFGVFIVVVFFVTMVIAKLYEKSKEEETVRIKKNQIFIIIFLVSLFHISKCYCY